MRSTSIAAALLATAPVASPVRSAAAPAADPTLVAPIHGFIDSFNRRDIRAVGDNCAPGGATIIDEAPPYIFTGPGACEAWATAVIADYARRKLSPGRLEMAAPTWTEVNGDAAYVIVPVTDFFTQQGVAMRDAGQMTYALDRRSGTWRIAGCAWTGGFPEAVKP